MFNKRYLKSLIGLIVVFIVGQGLFFQLKGFCQEQDYSFVVAGHSYGSHHETNIGLYPKFLNELEKGLEPKPDFVILNGDIVRHSTEESWTQIEEELAALNLPAYYVMGNHDSSEHSQNLFKKKYGNTYYSFQKETEQFIILDCQQPWGSIPAEQLLFLKEQLENSPGIKNVFIFFHELLWTARNPKYRSVKHNFGSYNRSFKSNFWNDVFPLLERHSDKKISIIAGDVGGNPGAIPAFYEGLGHVTLIASGMGEIRDENYLLIRVHKGQVELLLKPLNEDNTLSSLQEYSLENLR